MTEQAPCPECGKPLPAGSAHDLCPACLMGQVMASQTLNTVAGNEAAAPPPTPEEIADKFPQFEVVECLGRGGMGVVYKARQKSLDRWVAIKVLAPERVLEDRFAAHFEREAKTLAKMSHPNIVTVFDHGQTDGLFYIVMEFVDGLNLRDLLREAKMEPEQALAIIPPICDALEYAHDKGVVHRDIKPENILLDRDGRVKIADFGIASLVGASGEKSGTPPYMAPEQEMGVVDRRADIYALGAVLYEMLTGERPTKDLVAPSKRVEIDVRLDEIVLRALEKEPARRYQTAGEFRTVVETMAAPNIDRAAGHPPEETTVHAPQKTGPAEQEKNSGDFFKHIRILSTSYQIIGVLLMIGAFIPPIVAGIALARDKSDWHEILPLMIAAIFAWPVGLGLGGFLVYLGNELRKNHRPEFCHVSAIILLVLSILTFPPLAILAIYTLIVLKKDDVAKAGDSDMKPTPGFSSGNRPRGMFARFWWLFLGILALGPLIGAMIGARMMPPTSDAFTETVILAILLSPLIALGLIASLHRFFPEPQPRLWTASVAGALVIALVLTMDFGIKFLDEIPTAALVQVPPGPVPDESLNAPEHAARSFMAALRDGDIDAAMNWVAPDSAMMSHPDFSRWKTLPEALKSISDELRQEAYAGELERLVQFTEWVPENRAGNADFLVVGVAAPSKMTQPPLPYALYLILSSTPEGWRVAHFGDSASGKSLVKHLEDFLGLEALRHPVESSSPNVPSTAEETKQPKQTANQVKPTNPVQVARSFMEAIRDGDMDAAKAWVAPEMKQREKFPLYLELASKILRDQIYVGQLELLTQFIDTEYTNVDGTTMLFATRIAPPTFGDRVPRVLILSTTPDGWKVVEFNDGGTTKSLSEHLMESHRQRVLGLPVSPPLTMPKDSPLTAAQAKELLQGVTWGDLVTAISNNGNGRGISVRQLTAGGENGPLYEVAFDDGNKRTLLGLRVDWQARHAEPIRLHAAAKPDQGHGASSEILPPLVARYAKHKESPAVRQVELLDADAHNGPVVLDLASGELLSVPKDLENPSDFSRHFTKLGKGDIAWDVGAIITLRGARLSEWLDNGWTMRNPERELDGSGGYRITVPARLRVTTAEGGHYIVDVREKIEPEKGVRIGIQRPESPETTNSTPEAKLPLEGAEIRRFVLELPVQPPLAVPKDSPLTIDQVKEVLKGVTWGKLLAALAEDGSGDNIMVWNSGPLYGKDSRYRIAFSYGNEPNQLDLAVDWRFRSAEPSLLRNAAKPDIVLTDSSEFLPQLVIRYAMKTGHDAAAPSVDEAKALAQKQITEQTKAAAPEQENRGEPSSYPGNVPRIPSAVVSHPQATNTRFGFIRQSGIFGLLIAYLTVILFFAGAVLIVITRSRKVLKVFFFLAFLPAVAGLCGTYLGNRKIDAHVRGGLDTDSAEGHALVAHGRSVANVTSYLGAGATAALWVAVASGLLITRTSPDKRLVNMRNP